jgi:hypothetical protein
VPEDLDDLAGALADGDEIDWRAAHARLTSPDSRSVAEGLESISRISSVPPGEARPSRRLPLLLEVARLLSAGYCLAGVVGLASRFEPRDIVVASIFGTFAGAAAFLEVCGRDRRTRALAACFWTTAGAFASRGILKLPAGQVAALRDTLITLRPEAFFALACGSSRATFPALPGSEPWTRSVAGVCARPASSARAVCGKCPAADAAVDEHCIGDGTATSGRRAGVGVRFPRVRRALAALAAIAWRSRLAEGVERARVASSSTPWLPPLAR